MPKNVLDAYILDNDNGDDFWRNSIAKEIKNMLITFYILDRGENVPANLNSPIVHLVFDVNTKLTHKARSLADGNSTKEPVGTAYSGVVSRKKNRIALTNIYLNGLYILADDIQNTYLTAPTTNKHFNV